MVLLLCKYLVHSKNIFYVICFVETQCEYYSCKSYDINIVNTNEDAGLLIGVHGNSVQAS